MSKKAGPKLVDFDVAGQRLSHLNSRRRHDGIPLRSPRPPVVAPHADINATRSKYSRRLAQTTTIEVEYQGEKKTFVSLRNFRCLLSLDPFRRLSRFERRSRQWCWSK